MIFVLDASALLRGIDHEAGAQRIAEILDVSHEYSHRILISALQYGEALVASIKETIQN